MTDVNKYVEAVGLLTTLKPDMIMDPDNPLSMAREIIAEVEGLKKRAEAERLKIELIVDLQTLQAAISGYKRGAGGY